MIPIPNEIQQVELYELLFTMNWEDPRSDERALRIKAGDVVATVTSGGCNALEFLRYDPSLVYGVDINPTQTWLMELKMAAMREMDHRAFVAFFGLTPSTERWSVYQSFRHRLSTEAAQYWDSRRSIIEDGVLFSGRFERYVRMAARMIGLLQGSRRVNQLLIERTEEEQKRYFAEVWDTRRLRAIFRLLFNKRVLARKGLSAEYFHFDDGALLFSVSFYNRFRRAVRDIPTSTNYFLAAYLLGRYLNTTAVPGYLHEDHYEDIRTRLDRITLVTQDAKLWLESHPSASIDCFALSNICELMSLSDTERLFAGVVHSARPGARVIFRNLMVPRDVPESLRDKIVIDNALSRELLATDRSFVYSKVAAYTIR